MERHKWGEDDERDPDLTKFRDEATSKNAVRNRLRIDRIDLPPDRLAGVVSCGRDFFHTFVSGTLRSGVRSTTGGEIFPCPDVLLRSRDGSPAA